VSCPAGLWSCKREGSHFHPDGLRNTGLLRKFNDCYTRSGRIILVNLSHLANHQNHGLSSRPVPITSIKIVPSVFLLHVPGIICPSLTDCPLVQQTTSGFGSRELFSNVVVISFERFQSYCIN
jgi:hypothetical protein